MADALDAAAIRCWNLLSTGQGGIDLGQLELAMEWVGLNHASDVDGLLHRLYLIRTHTPQALSQASAHTDTEH